MADTVSVLGFLNAVFHAWKLLNGLDIFIGTCAVVFDVCVSITHSIIISLFIHDD